MNGAAFNCVDVEWVVAFSFSSVELRRLALTLKGVADPLLVPAVNRKLI